MEKKSSGIALALMRGITALLIGGLLVFWSQSAVLYLIMVIGCLFLIPGLFSLLTYYRKVSPEGTRRFGWPQVLGVGSILFGLCLIVSPEFFEMSLMYALGIILSYAGLSEIIQLVAARQWVRVPGAFYVTPVLVMLTGIFILFNPIETANIPFIILGIGCIVYGISDMVNIVKFRRRNSEVEELEVVNDEPKEQEIPIEE
ncbi:MAG: DUF308 domain-containing protein [Bacteroidaceae bacterium]|nr:DUF308 domain-containing protein [Bacteroidaceae bacterium]